jgi:hypothetical protein
MSAEWCEARTAAVWSRRREHEVAAAIGSVASHAHSRARADTVPTGAAGGEGLSLHQAPWHRPGDWGIEKG